MKKHFLLLSLLFIALVSCKKTAATFDAAKQVAEDDVKIKAYIAANNINATKDPSGVYYQVITPGTGSNPTSTSTVTVNYTGKLLDGTQFDSGNISTPLANVIKGWQIGIPYDKAGGRILLIIPSGLAYGNSSPGASIPANSVLVFTVDLISFK